MITVGEHAYFFIQNFDVVEDSCSSCVKNDGSSSDCAFCFHQACL